MIAALNSPVRRITLAIALSVLIHAAILWLPDIQFPRTRIELPPLSVRIEPVPQTRIADTPKPAKAEPATPLTKPGNNPETGRANRAMARLSKAEESIAARPFPRHLQLTFIVYRGGEGSRIGEIHQQLDISGNRYTLKSERETAGLSSLRNSDRITQTSSGKIGEHGLQPDTYEEEKITRDGKQGVQATFDWVAQKLRLQDGGEIPLPRDTQDILSFIYQISQLPMHGEYFAIPVSDGAQLLQYQIEIGTRAELATPLGKLPVLHLREMHESGAAYFEIWLGLQYRLLPVKFRLVDSSDKVAEEFVISGIRASDK